MGKVKLFDIVIILVLLTLSVIPMASMAVGGEDAAMVSVTVGDTAHHYSLDTDREESITNKGYTLSVKVEDGSVSVVSSDCEDKICMYSGIISNAGSAIVCLPADIVIEIEADEEANDAVAG